MEELIVFEILFREEYGLNFQLNKAHMYNYIGILAYSELELDILFHGRYYINYYHITARDGYVTHALAKSIDSKQFVMIGKGHPEFIELRRIQTINEIIN